MSEIQCHALNSLDSVPNRRMMLIAPMAALLPTSDIYACEAQLVLVDFLQEVEIAYEQQVVGFDMEDVETMLDSVRYPALGVGHASGEGRAAAAAAVAVTQAGQLGLHNLMIVSGPRDGVRLREYAEASRAVQSFAATAATVIYGAYLDESLARGCVRVSLLTG